MTASVVTGSELEMTDNPRRGFGSDNQSGAHPEVLASIAAANDGHVTAYGDDQHTAKAAEVLRGHLGEDADIYFVLERA